MPEQNNWKEELRLIWHKTDFNEKVTFIEKILSSQAHALKEQMKGCVPDKEQYGEYDDETFGEIIGHNRCREQTLSAIESIEI